MNSARQKRMVDMVRARRNPEAWEMQCTYAGLVGPWEGFDWETYRWIARFWSSNRVPYVIELRPKGIPTDG